MTGSERQTHIAPIGGGARSADSGSSDRSVAGGLADSNAGASAGVGSGASGMGSSLFPSRPLAELTAGLVQVPAEIVVRDVTLDSRAASPGSLFLACKGRTTHGLRFARQAVALGASAVLYEETADHPSGARSDLQLASELGSDIFVAAVPKLSQHVGAIADRFFGEPSQSLTVVGITGTNGKTTCAWLLAQALQHCQRPAGYMGTLGFGVPPSVAQTEHTTPDAVGVHRQLATLKSFGAEWVSMEVSSHAIDQDRVGAVRFHTAAFTNLTRDHLDYHGTLEAYGAAKARLFAWPSLTNRIINVDDAFGAQLAAQHSAARLVITARAASAPGVWRHSDHVHAVRATPESRGLNIEIQSSWGSTALTVPLIGEFNIDNVLTVLAVLLSWNIPLAQASTALSRCTAPSGRMEMFGGIANVPLAIVDYAHTPDALAKALRAARGHCEGRLWVVFGCGGDRDAGKRPQMGRIAEELADVPVITDDNPRTEDPARIVADILAGLAKPAAALVEHDRARAIQTAFRGLASGDVLVVAGKGHEDYQIYGTARREFSDQAVLRAELERLRS
jgi:UDP-N-acetylmuramoyl-L-alanyl-D-glutamate--2,6-diaminopimelate ligase